MKFKVWLYGEEDCGHALTFLDIFFYWLTLSNSLDSKYVLVSKVYFTYALFMSHGERSSTRKDSLLYNWDLRFDSNGITLGSTCQQIPSLIDVHLVSFIVGS